MTVPRTWLLSAKFMCVLCIISYNDATNIPDKRQADYAATLSSYELVFPRKVSAKGDFMSHDVTQRHPIDKKRRSKRHVRDQPTVHYSIQIDNQDHVIEVKPNRNFIAPHAVVERRSGDNRMPLTNSIANISSDIKYLADDVTCHYTGFVRNHTRSSVAISTCDGLHGYLKTDTSDYFIEPLKKQTRSSTDPHGHIIYRTADTTQAEPGQSHCATPGVYEEALQTRDRWQQSQPGVPKRRRKRSVSVERNVEVLVVADRKMIDYYTDEDLNTYILTIMNMVSTIYHDASIGNAVNIVVVKIMLLETPQYETELEISHSADSTLLSFCQWQKMVNPTDDDHPHHHDVAVLLTRYNICSQTNNRCSTLGLAEIAGMCQAHRSCNVNEDTGLQIAYTIAHEIGHNFGMNHDSFTNGCGSKYGFSEHVMSPHLSSDSVSITWSNCSRSEITQFLDRQWGGCLEDEPLDLEYDFPALPPGAMYDADHQCRLAFGPQAKRCNGMDSICDALWCQVDNRCVTRLEPAAEGTQCGKHQWCYLGTCVTMGEKPAAIHGNWGQWSDWSACSRHCGAGVESADRHCDNPAPASGGKYCTGDRRRYRICNTQDCSEADSMRAEQCSNFDTIPYKGKNHTWQPVTLEDTPCQLHCKPDNEFYSVQLKNTVMDGTPCKPGTRDMCIHGICKRVACDWTLEGNAQEDRCGVCHGDGTQCITTRGSYRQLHGNSYVKVVTLPLGARNIRIEEQRDAPNYLAIKNPRTAQYYLNGNWIIQWSGEYTANGVMMYYKREGEKESLLLPGPLKQPLDLMLLFQVENPGVSWEYTLAHENVTYKPVFEWKYSEWSVCTHTCGGGAQLSKVQCIENEAGLVEDKYCSVVEKPVHEKRVCNTHSCPAWWWTGPWQPCSLTCGDKQASNRKRTVICVRSYGLSEQVALLDSDCVLDDKPHERDTCPDLQACRDDTFWTVGPWIQSCEEDPCEFEQRPVRCSHPSGKCEAEARPPSLRQCGNITCGYWAASSWSQCSVSCGEGLEIRNVSCIHGVTCALKDEPRSVRECAADCPEPQQTHLETPPTSLAPPTVTEEPSAPHTVLTTNHDTDNLIWEVAENEEENTRTNETIKSTTSLEASTNEIVAEKITIDKSSSGGDTDDYAIPDDYYDTDDYYYNYETSVHTNTSLLRPTAIAEDKVDVDNVQVIEIIKGHTKNHHKTQRTKKVKIHTGAEAIDVLNQFAEESQLLVELTNNMSTYEWQTGNWSKCDEPCGKGTTTRTVHCSQVSSTANTLVSNDKCSTKQPPHKQTCNEFACLSWDITDWAECSVACGQGMKHRNATCPEEGKCHDGTLPHLSEECVQTPCVDWVRGPWSMCTKSCNGGYQIRFVKCIDQRTQEVSQECQQDRPVHKMSCNQEKCPTIQNQQRRCKDHLDTKLCRRLLHMCSTKFFRVKCCQTCRKRS